MGPTACPQFCTAGTRTLGWVSKKGLSAEFARSRPVPGVLPPKGAPHKDVHLVPVSLWHDGAHEIVGVTMPMTKGQYCDGGPQR